MGTPDMCACVCACAYMLCMRMVEIKIILSNNWIKYSEPNHFHRGGQTPKLEGEVRNNLNNKQGQTPPSKPPDQEFP